MPVVSTVQTHANFTASHNRLILGTATDILQSEDLPGLLKISDTLWNFIIEQLSKTTELQLFSRTEKSCFSSITKQSFETQYTK